MGRAEVAGGGSARALDCPNAETNVPAAVERAPELELAVEVAMIAKLVALLRHPPYQLGPAFGVAPEYEESRPDSLLGERVEDQRSCLGVRPVIEGQCHDSPIARNPAQRRAEERTIPVESTMHHSAYNRDSQRCVPDHSRVARPSTAV